MGFNKQPLTLARLDDLIDRRQWAEALTKLLVARGKQRIDLTTNDIRERCRRLCQGVSEDYKGKDDYFSRKVIAMLERAQDNDTLEEYADFLMQNGSDEQALQSYRIVLERAARDKQDAICEKMLEHGKELMSTGGFHAGFDFIKASGSTEAMSDPMLSALITDRATMQWNQGIKECDSPGRFVTSNMPRVLDMFEAVGRPDLLYGCGKVLERLERTVALHQNAHVRDAESWAPHVLNAYKKAAIIRPFDQAAELNREDLLHIAQTLRTYGNVDEACAVYVRIGEKHELIRMIMGLLQNENYKKAIDLLRYSPMDLESGDTDHLCASIEEAILRLRPLRDALRLQKKRTEGGKDALKLTDRLERTEHYIKTLQNALWRYEQFRARE